MSTSIYFIVVSAGSTQIVPIPDPTLSGNGDAVDHTAEVIPVTLMIPIHVTVYQ
jgi:hypothetical protein